MPRTQVIKCECGRRIRLSVRDSGKVTVLGTEKEEYSPLEELRRV